MTLQLDAETPPSVEITSSITKAQSDAKLTIEARVVMGSLVAFESADITSAWSLTKGELTDDQLLEDVVRTQTRITTSLRSGTSYSSRSYAHDLVLSENSLVAGGSYAFQLTASTPGSTEGFAVVELTVRLPPSSGWLEISPESGMAFFELFELRAVKWVGDEPPLKYRFEIRIEGANNLILRTATLDNALKDVRLPPANNEPLLDVYVVVSDAVGASATASAQVDVLDASLDGLAKSTADALEVAFANYSLNTVCQIVAASAGSAAGRDSDLLAHLVPNLTKSFDMFGDNDQDIAEQIIAALLAPTGFPTALLFDTGLDALELTRRGLDILVATGLGSFVSMAPSVTATVLSNLLESQLFTNTTASESSLVEAAQTLLESIDALTLVQRNELVENEDAYEFSSKNLFSASRVFSSALGDRNHTIASGLMNASANVTANDGVVYQVSVTEFEVNPHGEQSDSQVVRFHVDTNSTTTTTTTSSADDSETAIELLIPGSASLGRDSNQSQSLNVTANCECGFVGLKNVTCPDGVSHELACNGTEGVHLFACNTSRHVCATWDAVERSWMVPDYCRAVERKEGSTSCQCILPGAPELSDARDYSTLAEITDAVDRYATTFRTTPNVKDSLLVLFALGSLLALVLFAHGFGYFLDKYDEKKVASVEIERSSSRTRMQMNALWNFFPTEQLREVPMRVGSRIARVMTRRHPIVNYAREYNSDVPRTTRAWKLGLEVAMFFAALGLETDLEYPDVKCKKHTTRHACHLGRGLLRKRVCEWEECGDPKCFELEPGSDAANSLAHFIVLMIVMALMLPVLAFVDFVFEQYLMAPCPRSLRCWFVRNDASGGDDHQVSSSHYATTLENERRQRAERDGDEVYHASTLDGDEVYRANAAALDEPYDARVFIEQKDDIAYNASKLDESTDDLREQIQIGISALSDDDDSDDDSSDECEPAFPDTTAGETIQEGNNIEDKGSSSSSSGRRNNNEDVKTSVPQDEVEVMVNHPDRPSQSTDILRVEQAWAISGTESVNSWFSASGLPALIELCVAKLRVDEEDVAESVVSADSLRGARSGDFSSAGSSLSVLMRSLGSTRRLVVRQAARPRRFVPCAAKEPPHTRSVRRKQMKTLVKKVGQAVLLRQAELQICMAEARRLPEGTLSERALFILKQLEASLLSDWSWVPSQKLWDTNIRVRVKAHMDEAFHLKQELDKVVGIDADDTRQLRIEKLLEAERCSLLPLTEKQIYQRAVSRALWQKSLPKDPPPVEYYVAAWLGITCLVAAIVWYCMQLATRIGKGKSKLWLFGVVTALFLFYFVILPVEILLFDYFIPSLLLERLKQYQDPTKLHRFPYKTKLPESPMFYLLLMMPQDYADTQIGIYAMQRALGSPVDTTSTAFYEDELEAIYHDQNWRARAGTRLGLAASSWIMRVPETLHELAFEEVLIAAVLFSKIMGSLPNSVGNSEGDHGEVLAMAVVVVVFAGIALLITSMIALCNCFEQLFLERGTRDAAESPRATPHALPP
ncbi:hypothetical protein CTAYLR_007698 [Chrysophaeum taylorii]|uniref:PKD/REJ-like domain-containing protein n=1 Tax=Chrysophaeum taylorii TaxID=2483200 RepID=A0AAD7XH16_9STRA|nr:hypothetical protein CTAYLR_007698 [Chrysophaeum taylorii]